MTNNNENNLEVKMPVVGSKYKPFYSTGLESEVISVDKNIITIRNCKTGIDHKWSINKFFTNFVPVLDLAEELPDQDNGNKPVETEEKPDSLPIQESNGTKNMEVEKAKEELNNILNNKQPVPDVEGDISIYKKEFLYESWNLLRHYAQNLLNAMDDSNIPEKGDCGIGEESLKDGLTALKWKEAGMNYFSSSKYADKKSEETNNKAKSMHDEFVKSLVDKPKPTLWKPVSELPEELKYPSQYIIEVGAEKYLATVNTCGLFSVGVGHKFGEAAIKRLVSLTDYINHQEELEKRVERLEHLLKY